MSATADLQPSPEQRRLTVQLAEKARQAINSLNFDYGIELLKDCCNLDPSALVFRKALRQTQKLKFRNNLVGSPAFKLSTWGKRLKLRGALQRKKHRDVLELGEVILTRNPWHTPTQLVMAQAAEAMGLGDVAVFILEQARQKNPTDRAVNLPLAQLLERLGNYSQAVLLYELAAKADPTDAHSVRKISDLSARDTLEKGQYEDRTFNPEDGMGEKRNAPLYLAAEPQASPLQKKLNEMDGLRTKIQTEANTPRHYLELAKHYRKEEKWEDARSILDAGLAATGRDFEIVSAITDLEIEPFRRNLKVTQLKMAERPDDDKLAQAARFQREVLARETSYWRQRGDRSPSDHAARLELGIRLVLQNQADEAIPELQDGRKEAKLRWKALTYLGHAFKLKRNWPLAKRNYEEALLAVPPGDEESLKDLLFSLAKGAADHSDWPTALQHGNDLANNDYAYRGIGSLVEQWNQRLQGAAV